MKKMILVPEAQFRQMQQNALKNSTTSSSGSSSSNNSSLLGAIDRPVQQEMVKKINFALTCLEFYLKKSISHWFDLNFVEKILETSAQKLSQCT